MDTLFQWEKCFAERLDKITPDQRQKAGTLLALIPNRNEWQEFLSVVRSEWLSLQNKPHWRPGCLLTLYGGLAFYEYRENTFWQQFADAAAIPSLSANQQKEINESFAYVAGKYGLRILKREHGSDYVGSAIYHIGVPLSLWSGFLEICEWALWQDNWRHLLDDEWKESISKRAGSRTRLIRFLTDNREAASDCIQEMLDARRLFSESESLTISEVKECLFLREEYFEEVPETADFLRPANPDSLFRDRARLVWEEQRNRICLYLPAVSPDKLPATWHIGDIQQQASNTPATLVLNAAAFSSHLSLGLQSNSHTETQRLLGLSPCGLFDLQRNKFVNHDREQLPIGAYAIISASKLYIKRKGFDEDEDENPLNELYELKDGTTCYVTRLCPKAKIAEIEITDQHQTKKIRFCSREGIETRILPGIGNLAMRFIHTPERIQVERLPLVCVSIPTGYVNDAESAVRSKVQVTIGDAQNYRVCGEWQELSINNKEREVFFWCWDSKPLRKNYETTSHHGWDMDFWKSLKPNYETPDLTGSQAIQIRSLALGLQDEHVFDVLTSRSLPEDCWKNLPGDYLPWVLLCQSSKGMQWDELANLRNLIAPDRQDDDRLQRQLYDYKRFGFLTRDGGAWTITESRAKLQCDETVCEVSFCGDPSILWGLYRHITNFTSDAAAKPQTAKPSPANGRPRLIKKSSTAFKQSSPSFPIVEIVSCSSRPPFLTMRWRCDLKEKIQHFLKQSSVRIVSDLWRP